MDRASVSETEGCGFESHQAHMANRLILILDNIRSVLNVGSIFRTADAVKAEVWLCGISPTPEHSRIAKTALGAEYSVKWRCFENTLDAIAIARKEIQGIKIVVVEQLEGSENIWDVNFPANVALVFGHEKDGVSKPAIDEADQLVEVPMLGKKESLNVAVVVGMVSYEVVRQWNRKCEKTNNGKKD